jgi:hypothetical protein
VLFVSSPGKQLFQKNSEKPLFQSQKEQHHTHKKTLTTHFKHRFYYLSDLVQFPRAFSKKISQSWAPAPAVPALFRGCLHPSTTRIQDPGDMFRRLRNNHPEESHIWLVVNLRC